jgi:cytidine deaminase
VSSAQNFPHGFAPLAARARKVARNAYAPHSKFRVGAAVRTARGAMFDGCNVENASFGLTMCAERNAIAAAVAAEGAKMRLARVAIFVDAAGPFPPCGACRQVIAEFADPETMVVYFGTRGAAVVTTIGELLPQAFRL